MSFPKEQLHIGRPNAPYLPGCNPINLSNRGRHSREYLDAHKNVEKRRRDRINNCLETIRQCVPACRKVPLSRRLEKGEILDMTISYLQLVNHFLAGIGVHDVYSASKQELHLYTGVDNWIRENHGNYTSVSEFAQDLRRLLQNEMEIFTAQITMEHSWLSRKSAAFGDMYTEDDGYTQMAAYAGEADCDDEKPFVPSYDYDKSPPKMSKPVPNSPPKPVLIKQECCLRESSAESPTKKLKLVENSTVIKSLDSPQSKSYMCANIASPPKKPKLVENPIPKLVANPFDRSLDNGEGTTHQGGSIAVLQSRKEISCQQRDRDTNMKTNEDSIPSVPSSDVQSHTTCSHPQITPVASKTAPSSQSQHHHPQRPPVAVEVAPRQSQHSSICIHPQTSPVESDAPTSQSHHTRTYIHPKSTPVASESAPSSQSYNQSTCSHLQRHPIAVEVAPSFQSEHHGTCSHPKSTPVASESAPSSQSHNRSTCSHPQRHLAVEVAPSFQSEHHGTCSQTTLVVAGETTSSSRSHPNSTSSHLQRPPIAVEVPPSSQPQHHSTCSHPQTTPAAGETASCSQSHHSNTSSHSQRPPVAGDQVPPGSCMPCNSQCHSLGDVRVSTSMGCVTIPIRLGSIQIAAPKEMLQPLQQACISPIVFNAQIESSDCPPVGEKCLCTSRTCQQQQKSGGLSIQVTESKEVDKT